jgi:hypothetical protein
MLCAAALKVFRRSFSALARLAGGRELPSALRESIRMIKER